MMRTASVGLLGLTLTVGCDHTGAALRPKVTDVPGITDLGALRVIGVDEWSDPAFNPAQAVDAVVYGQLGALENPGAIGGATFSFKGTGAPVCVVVDPESLFWATPIGPEQNGVYYQYEDNYQDDADLDLSVGLTAYYTGSPGVEIGDFIATYTDQSGLDHELEFNECVQSGYQGTPDVHSGRATAEDCAIDTAERSQIGYTGLIRTFALPINDSIANYAVGVFELPEADSTCSDLGVTECTFRNETSLGVGGDAFDELEQAFCQGTPKTNKYCEEHLGDPDPLCFLPGTQ